MVKIWAKSEDGEKFYGEALEFSPRTEKSPIVKWQMIKKTHQIIKEVRIIVG